MFKVEKGIKIPNKSKYPFKEMNVGDSFSAMGAQESSIRQAAYHAGIKIAIRKITDTEIRVWRTK